MTELPIQRLRDDAVVPDAGLRGGCRARPRPRASGWSSGPGSGPSSAPGSRSRSPRGTPASSSRAPGWRPSTAITILNTPGLIDSGYRGEVRVVLLNTDPTTPFVVEPGMRIAQLVVVPLAEIEPAEVDELPASERGVRGFGSSTGRS